TLVAGVFTSSMALYHFVLPGTFHWDQALVHYPTLRWGLALINSSFSFLLLAGGVITIAIAFAPLPRDGTGFWVLAAMGGYWLFNLLWRVGAPMPLPRALAGLRVLFLGSPAAVILLYAAALLRARPARGADSA